MASRIELSSIQWLIPNQLHPSQFNSGIQFAPGENVSFLIDNDAKDRVRTAVDIVDLVGGYVQLRRQGANFVGLCPFHEDRRPSFNVNPTRQTWKCWVCDLGGDVFSFLMEKERISFPEALQMLADRVGIVLEQKRAIGKQDTPDYKKSLYEAMDWACREFHQCLLKDPAAETARSYLAGRGISDESIQRFHIGYAPDAWNWLMDRGVGRGLKAEILEVIGLAAKSERGSRYDRFRGRVLFPIRDPQGRAIAVGGRILPGAASDQAKYVNCNETRLYHKSSQLYGLDLAKEAIQKSRVAVVMEGYTDVIMASQYGIQNAVAVCGTALGESHIRLLKRYCDSVTLLLDGDEAGQKRTNEILELFIAAQMDLRVATLPDDLDPCDFLIQRGSEAMSVVLSKTVDALEHKLIHVCKGFDPLTDTHRANVALEQMLDLLSKASRTSLLSNDAARIRQEQILMRLSRRFGVETPDLKQRLEGLRKQVQQRLKPRLSDSNPSMNTSKASEVPNVPSDGLLPTDTTKIPSSRIFRFSDLAPIDRELFEILVLHAELVPFALERFPMGSLVSDAARQLWQSYMDLELEGYSLDFGSMLSAIEDATLKNILVSLAEEATQKAEIVKLDADERLHTLCERLSRQEQMVQDQQQLRVLEAKQLSADDEINLLQQVIDQARARQGLLPPKG
jgi:DNA primase